MVTKKMKIETQKEIENEIKRGRIQVSLNTYKDKLKLFGLKLDMNSNNYLSKYYNTLNKQHYLDATSMALDSTGFSFCNIFGDFYKNQKENNTQLYKDFCIFRNKYFTVLKSGHILSI